MSAKLLSSKYVWKLGLVIAHMQTKKGKLREEKLPGLIAIGKKYFIFNTHRINHNSVGI